MKAVLRAVAALLSVAAAAAPASTEDPGGRRAAPASDPAWEFEITAYPNFVRSGDNFTSAVAAADHGALHLEARYDYESVGARSAFIGWTFSGGGETVWELTPIAGGAWGTTQAFVPGLEAAVAHGRFDFYVEAEYVRDRHASSSSYLYAWSEFGFRAVEWLRLGVAGQRTRVYGGERDVQRGPFAEFAAGRVTIAGYWFNPGSNEQVVVASIGVTF